MINSILDFLGFKNKDSHFSDFKKPLILEKLENYQKEKKADWESLEFWIDYDIHYGITPMDVIPFANTGNNGIHFGFLTDFGLIKDLEKSPIVCIAPSYDPPINIVAKDINQFLSFTMYAENSSLLADIYENEKEFEDRKKEYLGWQMTDELILKRKATIEILKNDFKIKPENNIIPKIRDYKIERNKNISTETFDGVNLIFESEGEITEFDYNKSTFKVREFIKNSNLNSRIKFYRQATFIYILTELDDWEIKKLIIQSLKKDGFIREAKILNLY